MSRWKPVVALVSFLGLVGALLLALSVLGQPSAAGSSALDDWPQLAHDAQRSHYTPHQVNPPYCYIWKWYEVPFASRAQPVVVAGRLFMGGMDGILCCVSGGTHRSLSLSRS